MVSKPGWRWSNDVKPLAKTSSCEAPHFQYHVSGRLAIRMDDGREIIAGPGVITSLPSGHDALARQASNDGVNLCLRADVDTARRFIE